MLGMCDLLIPIGLFISVLLKDAISLWHLDYTYPGFTIIAVNNDKC